MPRKITPPSGSGDLFGMTSPRTSRNTFAHEGVREAIRRAATLAQLPNGWNSYGAKPVSPRAVHHATRLLRETACLIPNVATPSVVPTVGGGLQLEWHLRGVDIEIEFGSDGCASWYAEDRATGEASEGPVLGHEDTVRQWLKRASV